MNSKVLSMLGMAKKAGKVTSGDFLCDKAIKEGISELIIIAEDASVSTKKSIQNACEYYGVVYIVYSDMERIGQFTGGGERVVASVNDRNFAKAIMKKYTDEMNMQGS